MALKRSRDTNEIKIERNTWTWLMSTRMTIIVTAQARSLVFSQLNGGNLMSAGAVSRKYRSAIRVMRRTSGTNETAETRIENSSAVTGKLTGIAKSDSLSGQCFVATAKALAPNTMISTEKMPTKILR